MRIFNSLTHQTTDHFTYILSIYLSPPIIIVIKEKLCYTYNQ
jgi:hypothetical protein